MSNDLDSLLRRIDELPIAHAKREAAKAELAAAFALMELAAPLVARIERLAASLSGGDAILGRAVAGHGELGEERPPAAD